MDRFLIACCIVIFVSLLGCAYFVGRIDMRVDCITYDPEAQ